MHAYWYILNQYCTVDKPQLAYEPTEHAELIKEQVISFPSSLLRHSDVQMATITATC